jgi:hypothetical protein
VGNTKKAGELFVMHLALLSSQLCWLRMSAHAGMLLTL